MKGWVGLVIADLQRTVHPFKWLPISCRSGAGQGVKHKVHQVQIKQIDSHKVCSNVRHWHKHKHASALAVGHLRHQSVTALCCATHAVDALAAHRCHELWSHTHVAEWQTMAPDIWLPNSPDLNPVDYAIWSVIQLDTAGNILRVYIIKVWNVMFHFH